MYLDKNNFLANIYQYTKHLFLHIDRDIFFANVENHDNMMSTIMKLVFGVYKNKETSACYYIFNKKSAEKYSHDKTYEPIGQLFTYEVYELEINKPLYRMGDLVGGLYFPNNDIGDEIEITHWGITVSTIKITDTTKIYLPLDDLYFFPLLCYYGEIFVRCKQKCDIKYNVVFISLRDRQLFMKCPLIYNLKTGIMTNMGSPDPSWLTANYPQIASARVIQKAWRNYKKRQHKQIWKKWMDDIQHVNNEIKYMPNFGIEYFNSLYHYNFNKECMNSINSISGLFE